MKILVALLLVGCVQSLVNGSQPFIDVDITQHISYRYLESSERIDYFTRDNDHPNSSATPLRNPPDNLCVIGGMFAHGFPTFCPLSSDTLWKVPVLESGQSIRNATYFENFLKDGKTIGIMGDSVMEQFADGLYCHFRRSGYDGDLMRGPLVPNRGAHMGCISHNEYLFSSKNYSLTIPFCKMYQSTRTMTETIEFIRNTNISIVNFGVHYHWDLSDRNSQLVFEANMRVLFQRYREIYSPEHIMIWRESAAQANTGVGGEFHGSYSELMNMSYTEFERRQSNHECMDELVFEYPITKQWREDIVRAAARDAGVLIIELGDPDFESHVTSDSPLMFWLPMYDLSLLWNGLHGSQQHCNPTHFCYTPYFWSLIYENLARILDATQFINQSQFNGRFPIHQPTEKILDPFLDLDTLTIAFISVCFLIFGYAYKANSMKEWFRTLA